VTPSTKRTLLFGVAYVGVIVAANWAVATFAPITVWPWPHWQAPAGVLFAGLAFTIRDLLHHTAGRDWTLAAIGIGTAVSFTIAPPTLALAAATAFGLSELADMVVYSPLAGRGRWLTAVVVSNTVGLAVDSALFLWLAFGSFAFLPGQIVGKLAMTVAVLPLLFLVRRRPALARADAC
jgi:queuosine precursor transporter